MRKKLLVSAGAAALLCVALPAGAQSYYGPYDTPQYQANNPPEYDEQGPPEVVYVYGPRPSQERSGIGAPIQRLTLSQAVRFDDLDLRTDFGIEALQERILRTADLLCHQMDLDYPGNVYPNASIGHSDVPLIEDGRGCYERAVDGAMAQADQAIAYARGER